MRQQEIDVGQNKLSCVVILSGGQDSTTCLYWAKSIGMEVHAVTFDYGQRHKVEIESAKKIAKMCNVSTHEIIDINGALRGGSPLITSNELAQYSSHDALPGGLEKTFVPMRNQLFMTIAANRAYVNLADRLVIGVSQEDYGGYPDCHATFMNSFSNACNLGTFTGEDGGVGPLEILTPLMNLSKAETVKMALLLPGCYAALAWTHTGYDGAYPPIGKDHATLLREKGFLEAGVPDPLILRAYAAGLMQLPGTGNYSEEALDAHLPILMRDNWMGV